MKTRKAIIGIISVAIGLFLFMAFISFQKSMDGNAISGGNGPVVTVYKSTYCGCCGGYISELEGQGFSVDVKIKDDLSSIKEKYNIPLEMQSCHTAVIEGYFIEGHVPIEAVTKLLNEMPDIDGIALPGMPSGSPGMPGQKTESWTVYALKDGSASEFMVV